MMWRPYSAAGQLIKDRLELGPADTFELQAITGQDADQIGSTLKNALRGGHIRGVKAHFDRRAAGAGSGRHQLTTWELADG